MSASDVVLVDTVDACILAVQELLRSSVIAVDLEGVDLGRHPGKACVMQMCCAAPDAPVYLFDIIALQEAGFEAGRLCELLGAPQVQKVFFDARADCDALFHNHNVSVQNAYDLQVLYHLKFQRPGSNLAGLGAALAEYGKTEIAVPELERLERVKQEGKLLFAPELGGSYGVWEDRPLQVELVAYCVADVGHMVGMRKLWGSEQLDKLVCEITRMRIAATTAAAHYYGSGMCDFEAMRAKATLSVGGVQETVRVAPGARPSEDGRNIRKVAQKCGVSATKQGLEDNVTLWHIAGVKEQVEEAVGMIKACPHLGLGERVL